MTNAILSKVTVLVLAKYFNAEGSYFDKFIEASDFATNLYMYGDRKNNITPWDTLSYEQAYDALAKHYKADKEKEYKEQ